MLINYNPASVKLVVGLGNPGQEYENTYHNIGIICVDEVAKKNSKPWKKITSRKKEIAAHLKIGNRTFIKPLTFMNNSGEAVLLFKKKLNLQPANILVVHDESDLPLGATRLSFGKRSAGHKGVESVINFLGTKDFWRLRIGTTSPSQNTHKHAGDFVLQKIQDEELIILKKVIETSIDRTL